MGRFPKGARLKDSSEFAAVKRRGIRVRSGSITLAVLSQAPRHPGTKGPRLGIVASRHVGNSVERNRIKRVVREFFRAKMESLPACDLVVILASGAAKFANGRIREDLKRAFEKLEERER